MFGAKSGKFINRHKIGIDALSPVGFSEAFHGGEILGISRRLPREIGTSKVDAPLVKRSTSEL
jgi:hypothetical protein